LPMLARGASVSFVNKSRLGGIARARLLTSNRRSSIARKAARARWARRRSGILHLSEIKKQVVRALADRRAKAYLFGSYARREATPRSDVDILVVLASPASDWLAETALLRRRLDFDRPVDLIVMDEASYNQWRNEVGSIQHKVASEGVRLV
jgi:predicted nucleotidyltransferase